MRTLLADIRYAVRSFAGAPGFTTVAVLTLALGISANAAIFSVVNAVLLRPLPFRQAGQLVRITSDLTKAGSADVGLDPVMLGDLERSGLFDHVAGLFPINVNLTGVTEAERIEGQLVGVDYFRVLGVEPQLGRLFGAEDAKPGITEVAVITDSLWQRRFGGDRNVLGRSVRLDDDLYVIIGVLPPAFRHPGQRLAAEPEMFAPAGYSALPFNAPKRGQFVVNGGAVARMKAGVTLAAVRTKLDEMGRTLRADFPAEFPASQGWAPRVLALQEDLVGKSRQSLLVLLGAVGAVLLIACANVANLMLARASARRREFAIRLSLGASRARVVRQLLTESLMLAAGGCVVGLLGARWLLRALVALVPAGLPRASEISLDIQALGFTVVISIGTALLFGLWPAWQSSTTSADEALRAGRASTGGASRTRARSVIIVAEFALALVLLVTASLLVRSFASLYRIDPGFSSAGVVTAQLWMPLPNDPSKGAYTTHPKRVPFLQKTEDRLRQMPGVQAVGWTTRLPLAGGRSRSGFVIEGQPVETALVNFVEPLSATPGYFPAMGISLVRGRLFDDRDTVNADPVIVVSESMAARYFQREDPVGRRIRPGAPNSTAPWLTIVGVVRDVRMGRLEQDPLPQIYRCAWQSSSLSMALVARTSGDPSALSGRVIEVVRSVDPELPLFRVRPMDDVLATSLADRRFAMVVLAAFASLALVLSAIGLYGVLGYLVRQRTSEIGLRIALGATPANVVRLIIQQGLVMAGAGIVFGLGGALVAARAMSSLLFGVTPFDPLVFGGISLLLLLISMLACYLPARWASQIDPLVALQRN